MVFADLNLARRLERAEGYACRAFAEARARLDPASGSTWMECAGAYAVFDGVDSPVTQSFGLGIFEEPTPDSIGQIERFFLERGAAVMHEVCPLAGISTLDLLCDRGYRPIEISSVLYQSVAAAVGSSTAGHDAIAVRAIEPEEAPLWASVHARGWAHDHPEFRSFLENSGALSAEREQSVCFLAELDGQPGAAGVLCLHQGVALFGGAATVPEMRRRGLQAALLHSRMRYALEQGCDLAMMVAEAGSQSQRNAERTGFRVAYTRTKWRLQKAQRHAPE
ncbi:MAG: GNAT family N-acetyltransferase [Silvibacterium sp.]|nr:GNAT family N-acetyltransferase [Silvibacterium sp.]